MQQPQARKGIVLITYRASAQLSELRVASATASSSAKPPSARSVVQVGPDVPVVQGTEARDATGDLDDDDSLVAGQIMAASDASAHM